LRKILLTGDFFRDILMNMTTYIVKNIRREGPGLILDYLKKHNKSYTIIEAEEVDSWSLPADAEALIILGGPDSANDDIPRIQRQLEIAKGALQGGVKLLGICLGMQILVKAAGGRILPNDVPEQGFRDSEGNWNPLYLLEAGEDDPLFAGLPHTLPVFHLHGETVKPNEEVRWLAQGSECQYQGVGVGELAYGFQCHLELTPEMLDHWLREDPQLQEQDSELILHDFLSIQDVYQKQCFQILDNFFNHLK